MRLLAATVTPVAPWTLPTTDVNNGAKLLDHNENIGQSNGPGDEDQNLHPKNKGKDAPNPPGRGHSAGFNVSSNDLAETQEIGP